MAVNSFKFMPRTLAESMKVWPYVDTSGEEIPWTAPGKPIQESKVALVSSGGLYCKDDRPFDLDRERREPLWGDPSFREIPRGISQQDIRAAHLHYENSHALEDYNCMLPLAALEDMLAEGRIGGISEYHLTFMGYQPRLGTFVRESAPGMAERLVEMDVDLVLLSSGWPLCVQSVGLAQRSIEERGLVTVSLTNMPFITEKIGVPRAVAVEFPFGMIWGHPGDREMQRDIMLHMLDAVGTIEKPGTIIELPYAWPEEDFRKRDWFPKEPTPWMSSQDAINEMLDFIQHGDPLE